MYAGRECQVAAWTSHKLVCGKVLRPSSAASSPSEILMAAANAVQASKSTTAGAKQHHAM